MSSQTPKKQNSNQRSKEMEEIYERYSWWHNEFFKQNGWLMGKLLTLADAAFADAEQRKAFKDLIKQTLEEHFRENARGNLICLYNEACNILVGEMLFSNDSPATLSSYPAIIK